MQKSLAYMCTLIIFGVGCADTNSKFAQYPEEAQNKGFKLEDIYALEGEVRCEMAYITWPYGQELTKSNKTTIIVPLQATSGADCLSQCKKHSVRNSTLGTCLVNRMAAMVFSHGEMKDPENSGPAGSCAMAVARYDRSLMSWVHSIVIESSQDLDPIQCNLFCDRNDTLITYDLLRDRDMILESYEGHGRMQCMRSSGEWGSGHAAYVDYSHKTPRQPNCLVYKVDVEEYGPSRVNETWVESNQACEQFCQAQFNKSPGNSHLCKFYSRFTDFIVSKSKYKEP